MTTSSTPLLLTPLPASPHPATKTLLESTAMKHLEKNPAAVALGRLGGLSKSSAKSAASRENGKKGGRPRKHPRPPES